MLAKIISKGLPFVVESHIASELNSHCLWTFLTHLDWHKTPLITYNCYWLRLAFLWLGFALTKSRESGMEIARKMWEAGRSMWNDCERIFAYFWWAVCKLFDHPRLASRPFYVLAPDAGCSRQYGWGRSGYRLNPSEKNSRDGVSLRPKFNLNSKTGMRHNGTFCSLPFFVSLEESSHTTWQSDLFLRGFLM